MLTLYHGRTSVCSLKARLALAEKALNFDSRLLTLRGDQFEPQYLKLNPNAVVPTLVHDDSVIIESTVIMHHVDEAFPGVPLMPQTARTGQSSHDHKAYGRVHSYGVHDADICNGKPRPSCADDAPGFRR